MYSFDASRWLLLNFAIAGCAGPQQVATPVPVVERDREQAATPVPIVDRDLVDSLLDEIGFEGTMRAVIRSEREWEQFWRAQHIRAHIPSPTGVDFSRYTILLVGRDTSGKALGTRVDRVSRERDTLMAYVDLSTGEPNCTIFPVSGVVIPKTDLPVRFVEPDSADTGCIGA